MKTKAQSYNVGRCGGVERTVDLINKHVEMYGDEIVNIAVSGGDLIVVYKKGE